MRENFNQLIKTQYFIAIDAVTGVRQPPLSRPLDL